MSASGPPARIQLQASASLHVGPIPHPEVLAAYGQVQPDLIERIVRMAEDEAKHRRSTETRIVIAGVRSGYIGQACGLIIGLAGLATAAYCTAHDHAVAGSIVAAIDLVSLVGVFVVGKRREPTPKRESDQLTLPHVK